MKKKRPMKKKRHSLVTFINNLFVICIIAMMVYWWYTRPPVYADFFAILGGVLFGGVFSWFTEIKARLSLQKHVYYSEQTVFFRWVLPCIVLGLFLLVRSVLIRSGIDAESFFMNFFGVAVIIIFSYEIIKEWR